MANDGIEENLDPAVIRILKMIKSGDSSGRKGKRVLEVKFKETRTNGEGSSLGPNSSGGDGGDNFEGGDGESPVVTEKIELVIDTESGRKLLTELLLPKDNHVVDGTQAPNSQGLEDGIQVTDTQRLDDGIQATDTQALSYVSNGALGFWMALTGFLQLRHGYEPFTQHKILVTISVLSLLYTKAVSAVVMHSHQPVGLRRYVAETGRYTTYLSAVLALVTLLLVFFTN